MYRKNQFLKAYARLERLCPPRLRRVLHWLHRPRARPVRVPVALLCLAGGALSFLPVLGLELLPIGMLLLAHDVPALRRPAGAMTMWLLDRYERGLRYARDRRGHWRAWCRGIAASRPWTVRRRRTALASRRRAVLANP